MRMGQTMKVTEDRFPLLFVYLEEEEEQQYNKRARTLTKGAAEIIGRWPQYVTFASYASTIGLLSLLVCFVLSVLVLLLTVRDVHNPRKFPVLKCDMKETSNHVFRLRNIDDHVTNGENATFIVETIPSNSNIVACAIESYLYWTNRPIYHIRIVESPDNSSIYELLQKKFKNYKLVTVRADSFLNGTTFANPKFRDDSSLSFLSKILISWNFGGTVFDSSLVTLSDYQNLEPSSNGILMGLSGKENVLIMTNRACHAFIFSLMKYMTKADNWNCQECMIKAVYQQFCTPGRNCSSIQILSKPIFCEEESMGCIFMKSRRNHTLEERLWGRICPHVKYFS